MLKHPWLRGSSIRFEVNNIINARPRVRDAAGNVPLNYQSDLLDPLGRTVMIRFASCSCRRAAPFAASGRAQDALGRGVPLHA